MDDRHVLAPAGLPRPETGVRAPTVELRLQEDEAALRATLPYARVSLVEEPVVLSVGVSVPATFSGIAQARREGVPWVRRTTGGSSLVHSAGDLLWSLVLPRSDPRVGRDYVRAFGRLGHSVVELLDHLGQAAAWVEPPGLSPEYCPLGRRGQVVAIGDQIVAGAAQHVTSAAILHHGFLAWAVDRATVDRLFGWSAPSPSDALVGLGELLAARASPRTVAADLERRLVNFVRAPTPGDGR